VTFRPTALEPAALEWRGDQPYSIRHRDIYHAADGVAEVQRVFIEPSRLLQRFAADDTPFTIGELGFGSGLNFAVAAERFLATAPASRRLHYLSIERHPFTADDFARCAAARAPELPLYQEMLRQYPPLLPGFHRRVFAGGRVMLTLYFGDVATAFQEMDGRQRNPVDAWFLDGFAPDRNPDMWQATVFANVAALARAGSTVATFTAAGVVRRGLEAAGFAVHRLDQRPHKRHTLAGTLRGAGTGAERRGTWPKPGVVHVLGAGLAGCATARQLAERDICVVLHDAGAPGANRLPATLHTRLSGAADDAGAHWRAVSYTFACAWHAAIAGDAAPGLLQFPETEAGSMPASRLSAIAARYAATGAWVQWLDAHAAAVRAGVSTRAPALYFPGGRHIDLAALCARLRDHPRIEHRVAGELPGGEMPLVLCTGHALPDQPSWLPLRPIWGQLDAVGFAPAPALPMVGAGVVNPCVGSDSASGVATAAIGASYEYRPWSPARATAFNVEKLTRWWTQLTGARPQLQVVDRWRGVRGVTADRMPVVGPYRNGDGAVRSSVWVNAGHGSAGTSTIPLSAEIIASLIAGDVPPVCTAVAAALDPVRFHMRAQRRAHGSGRRPAPGPDAVSSRASGTRER
jgi:tRNA 5-methylaminomethyl-2-thiouridine biosynthesis bifunctional protein